MSLEPIRRTYPEPPGTSKSRDVDAASRARALQAAGWALAGGLPLGGALGYVLGFAVIGALLGPFLVFGIVLGITRAAGGGAGVIYMPSGSTTPRKKEYSRAMALEVRGDIRKAIQVYQEEILDDPMEPEPYLRIARLFRDNLRDPKEAVSWFRRAQREARMSSGQTIRTHREVAELFLHTLREPRRAAPDLARLAELFPNTQDGRWASGELAEIKAEMAGEFGGAPEAEPGRSGNRDSESEDSLPGRDPGS